MVAIHPPSYGRQIKTLVGLLRCNEVLRIIFM